MAKTLVPTQDTVDLPDVFEEAGYAAEPTKVPIPIVVFAQPKATEQWTDLAGKIQGLQEGDQILVPPEPARPERINPMRFTMLACKQYWVKKDPAGNRLEVSAERKPRKDGVYKWGEEIFAACLVYINRGSEPETVAASVIFKTVKCSAAISVKLQIEAAEKPEWADNSPAHKMAFGAFAKPFLRVVGTVQTGKRTSTAGFSYCPMRATVSPATPAEWKAVKTFMENGGKDKLALLAAHYRSRLADMGL